MAPALSDRVVVPSLAVSVFARVGPRARSALWCAAVGAVALVLARVDPSETHAFGRCPTLWLTGGLAWCELFDVRGWFARVALIVGWPFLVALVLLLWIVGSV